MNADKALSHPRNPWFHKLNVEPEPPEDVVMSVNNSLNMLLSYPHKKHELGSDWISIDQSAVTELFNRLRGRRGENLFDQRM